MARYHLYAGMGGGFGGARYETTEDFKNESEALEAARELAIEHYQSYEGMHGVESYKDVLDSYCEENDKTEDTLDEEDRAFITECYEEAIEGWIDYKVLPADECTLDPEDYE